MIIIINIMQYDVVVWLVFFFFFFFLFLGGVFREDIYIYIYITYQLKL